MSVAVFVYLMILAYLAGDVAGSAVVRIVYAVRRGRP